MDVILIYIKKIFSECIMPIISQLILSILFPSFYQTITTLSVNIIRKIIYIYYTTKSFHSLMSFQRWFNDCQVWFNEKTLSIKAHYYINRVTNMATNGMLLSKNGESRFQAQRKDRVKKEKRSSSYFGQSLE